MKPVDTGAPQAVQGTTQPHAGKSEPVDELKAALEQRLWQMLSALPGIKLEGNPDQVAHVIAAEALGGAAGSTHGQLRQRDERSHDASAVLTSAAHMLALTIPQLGLMSYQSQAPAADSSSPPLPAATPGACWTMQLGHVDADGGSAALNVQHPLLGDIALDVELSQGAVRVIATVPNDYGARILLEGQQLLAERLLRQGVTLQALDVLVRRKRKDKDTHPARKRPRKEDR